MSPRRWRAIGRLAIVATWLLVGLLPGVVPPAYGAEYTMETHATYEVEPQRERVAVSVRVRFRNTTPNPSGEFSVFEVIDLALQPGATRITARDSRGALRVTETDRDGYVQASVRPRSAVRFRERATFTLSYRIPDGAAPGTRVRPSLVAFPAWSFGTSGSVTVNLPGSYEVSVAGDDLAAERSAAGWALDSGQIENPSRWVAQVVAAGEASREVVTRAVPLAGGTVDLQVRAWADDAAWGDRTLRLAADALPLIEGALGLPFPGVGPLVVEESVSASADLAGEPATEGTRLLAGYDQPPFTLVHQLGHVWLRPELVADRWITEGFASWAAARAAPELGGGGIELPFDPERRRESLADDRFPLVSWGVGEATGAQDAFAYAASWAVAEEIVDAVGADALRLAWSRIAAGIGPYAPVSDDGTGQPPSPTRPPLDSRALLDHLEAVADADLATLFAEWVYDDATVALLEDRAAARQSHARLLEAAAGWGAPDPVVVDLAAWRFESAQERISETLDWLVDRDRMYAAATETGLTVPQRLRDRYRTSGGSADARAELDAEQAIVDAYREAITASADERGMLERIGLLGGPEPDALLRDANALFAEGDLRGAADGVEEAMLRLEHAGTEGLVRIGAAVAVSAALIVLAWALLRRSRTRTLGERAGSDYTAAP
ncbi:MAG TPA: hypothetical protein VH859_09650 [Candidatus Limnocylindria bacterium]